MAKPWNLEFRFESRSLRAAALAAWCAMAIGLGGCRAVDNAQVDVLERELRQQEDYIYELEDYLIEYSEKLRQCRSCSPDMMIEGSTTSSKLGGKSEPTIAVDRPRSGAPRRPNGARVVPPIEDLNTPVDAFDANPAPATAPSTPGPSTPAPVATPSTPAPATPVDPAEMEAPPLEIGPTGDLQWKGAAPIATTPAGDEAPPYIPDPAGYQLDAESDGDFAAQTNQTVGTAIAPEAGGETVDAPELFAAEPVSPEVASEPMLPPATDAQRLTAERLQIRRVFGDPKADAGSLLVVVEALNATDEPVDANGEISLMVMAGETQETLKRVERWDFTADETQASWQSSQLGDGLHLELPLKEASLPAGRLELWARLVSADGTKLLTRLPFAANELTPLDAATVDATTAVAQDAAAASGEQLTAAPVEEVASTVNTAAASEPGSKWRASHEPLNLGLNGGGLNGGHATTAGAPASGWTSQPPGGRAPLPGTPRMASAAADGPPRWQQGTGEAPKTERDGVWAPFR